MYKKEYSEMSISVKTENNSVYVENSTKTIVVTVPDRSIVVSTTGVQGQKGDDGDSLPTGGLERQILIKNSSADSDVSWKYTWQDLVLNSKYTGTKDSIIGGDVLEYTIDGMSIYRYITTLRVNKYPVEDSFYSDFDGTNLTNLIVSRG